MPSQGGAVGGDRPEVLGALLGLEMSAELLGKSVEQRARICGRLVVVIPLSHEELSHALERAGDLHVLGRDRTPPAEE